MALVKSTFKSSLESKLYDIFKEQADKATSGSEDENPDDVIKNVADKMAAAISDAVDKYIKSGDIIVGAENIAVMVGQAPGVVTPLEPAKIS